jgi:pimeloyl-ACP methyl ester carboxylesterase
LLVNTIAQYREVILFDNAGTGQSSGDVPTTFRGWASDLAAFIEALGLKQVDLFGFSMGGIAVLQTALDYPELVRKLVIAGARASVPENGPVEGIIWPQEQNPPEYTTKLAYAVTAEEGKAGLKFACFPETDRGEAAFNEYWARISTRTAEPLRLDLLPMDPQGNNQYAALVDALTPQPNNSFDRLGELKIPVLVLNGDADMVVPTSHSYELLKKVENAQLILYPRSSHGFLWQYAKRVGEDTNRFLDSADFD